MLVGVFALVAAGGLFWLAYRRPRPRRWLIPRRQPVAAQAINGRLALPPAAVLTDPSSPERELERQLGSEPDVQAARWAEAAAFLRKQNRADSLADVLRCAEAAVGLPHGVVLAAEAVGFANFPASLHRLGEPDGRRAVRVLARAARGARDGSVDLAALVRAGTDDHLGVVSETAPADADPWVTAAMIEGERFARRGGEWSRHLPPETRALVDRQGARLTASAARRRDWLAAAVSRLLTRFPNAPADEQAASLRVLDDLRADVSSLFPGLPDRRAAWWADAVRALRWATGRDYGPLLAEQADRLLASRRPGSAACAVLAALRGVRCREAEQVLLKAGEHGDGGVRAAAISALGWADPFDRIAVLSQLRLARLGADAAVRASAVGALARFGELAALREFALGLLAEDAAVRQATCLRAAEEGVSWLWLDLDLVAGAADAETALAATEALERMREAALGLLG